MFLKRKDFFDGPGAGKEGAGPKRTASSKDKRPVAERETGATSRTEPAARTRAPRSPRPDPSPRQGPPGGPTQTVPFPGEAPPMLG